MHIDPSLYQKYPRKLIEDTVAKLNYHHVDPLPKTELPGVPTLYVFRHGQSIDNEKMLFSGWRDPELTQKGVEKALTLAEKLKDKKIDLLFASDLIRAINTMEIAVSKNSLAKKLEILKDPRIKERSYGDLQGTSKLELMLSNPELSDKYRRSYDVTPPGGESLATVVERVTDFIEDIVPKMKEFKLNVAVSCHGNSMRGFRRYFEHLSDEQTAHVESPLAEDYAAYAVL
jgi:2,3-bisphosphoglycerate-dependent phosphoglycerate mutase